ncbi:cytochrome P450 3A5 [Apodospora peruviana]|uniref:Cytochrome P450 3A5 n=1 Tax=Apodospora peruviana TaxID=516989 RepID=A0AAE0HTK4_9PEZI|nr:cytochrome P450 3A5 [Apodospora peruviana]
MDIRLTAILSLSETAAWTAISYQKLRAVPTIAFVNQFLLYFAVQYSILKFYRVVVYSHFVSPTRNIPSPKDNHPLIGQFGKLLTSPSPLEHYLKWHEQWPREPFVRYLTFGNLEMLQVNTPEAFKEVLQTHAYSFKKPDLLYRLVGDFMGNGLGFVEGAEHKRQRRVLNEALALSNLRNIFPVFQNKAEQLTEFFDEKIGGDKESVVDFVDCCWRWGLDTAGVTILGVELGHLLVTDDPKWNFLACYRRVLSPPKLSAVISFVNTAVPVRMFLPIEANLGYLRAARQLKEMMRQVVRQRIKDIGNDGQDEGNSRDLLSMMIEVGRTGYNGTKEEFSEENLVDQSLTFLGAGHETVAGMMVWSAYVLGTRQASPTWEDIDRLHYLDNFCKEVLRVYCPALHLSREALTDLTICGVFIPKGTLLMILRAVANLSKAVWGPDADKFIPERWDNLTGGAASPYAFQSFLTGPRICIGRTFGFMEAKANLVEVLSKFRLSESPELEALGGRPPPLKNPTITLLLRDGRMPVKLERI